MIYLMVYILLFYILLFYILLLYLNSNKLEYLLRSTALIPLDINEKFKRDIKLLSRDFCESDLQISSDFRIKFCQDNIIYSKEKNFLKG